MAYDVLWAWATLLAAAVVIWQFPEIFVAGMFLDGLSAEAEATEATEATEAAEVAEAVEAAEVVEVAAAAEMAEAFQVVAMADMADTTEAAGEALSVAAESGGWDFFGLLEGFEWE